MIKRELGNFQRAQLWVSEIFPFSAVVVLRVINGPDREILARALEYLEKRHPYLRSRVKREGKKYSFDFQDAPGVQLEMMEREDEDHWLRVSESLLDQSVDLYAGPMMKVRYIQGAVASEIIVMFQHLIMDAVSGSSLLHELLGLCIGINNGESIDTETWPEPGGVTRKLFPAPFRGFSMTGKILSFMRRQMMGEISFKWKSRGIRKAPVSLQSGNKLLTFSLNPEVTASLIRRSRKQRVTVNDLFNAAMMIAVQKHIYKGVSVPLRHMNFVDLRPYLEPPPDPHVLGSYFTIMRFTVDMPESPEIWEMARRSGGIAYGALKRGDKFCANLLSPMIVRSMLASQSSRMSETALSFTGAPRIDRQYGDIRVKGLHAFVSNYGLGPEYTAHVRFFDNRFCWDVLYLDCDMDEAFARVISNEIREMLEQAAGIEEVS